MRVSKKNMIYPLSQHLPSTDTSSGNSTPGTWWTKMKFWNGSWCIMNPNTTSSNPWTGRHYKSWSMMLSIWLFCSVSFRYWPSPALLELLTKFSLPLRHRQLWIMHWNPRGIGNYRWWHRQVRHPICQSKWHEVGSWDWNLRIPHSCVLRDRRSNYVWWWVWLTDDIPSIAQLKCVFLCSQVISKTKNVSCSG